LADGGPVLGSLHALVGTASPRGERSSGGSSASEPEWLRDAHDRLTDTDSCASRSRSHAGSPPPELLTRVAMLEEALAAATLEAGLAEAKAAKALQAEAEAQAAAQLAKAQAAEVQASAKLEVAASEARAAAASATAAAASATEAAAAAASVAESRRQAAKVAYDAAVADQTAAQDKAAAVAQAITAAQASAATEAAAAAQAAVPPPAAPLTAPPAALLTLPLVTGSAGFGPDESVEWSTTCRFPESTPPPLPQDAGPREAVDWGTSPLPPLPPVAPLLLPPQPAATTAVAPLLLPPQRAAAAAAAAVAPLLLSPKPLPISVSRAPQTADTPPPPPQPQPPAEPPSPSKPKPGQLTPGQPAGWNTGPADGGRTGSFDPRELYDPLGLIGRGSYGSVFRARDRRSGELVAIKVVHHTHELDYAVRTCGAYTLRTLGWPCNALLTVRAHTHSMIALSGAADGPCGGRGAGRPLRGRGGRAA
jgi:hypothetical protein